MKKLMVPNHICCKCTALSELKKARKISINLSKRYQHTSQWWKWMEHDNKVVHEIDTKMLKLSFMVLSRRSLSCFV